MLSKPRWFNPYAVTPAKRILLFKVTKFEQYELQNESNVLSVVKRLFLFSEITECSFLKYLAKTGIIQSLAENEQYKCL